MSAEPLDFASTRYLNESAIRNHALRCSASFRAARFKRVGQDFLDEVKADVEAVLRELRNKMTANQVHPPLASEETFITGVLQDRAGEILNDLVARIIQAKVQRQPSCGQTLSRTR